MEVLVKEKVDEVLNVLDEFVYVLNTEEFLKVYDILVPTLMIATGEITRTLDIINKDLEPRAKDQDTIYTYFMHIKKDIQDKIINDMIKDIEKMEFIKLKPTKDIIITYIASEFHITMDAVDQKLEIEYLLFFTSFIVLFFKSIFKHSFYDFELEEKCIEGPFSFKRIELTKKEIELFIFLVNRHKSLVN